MTVHSEFPNQTAIGAYYILYDFQVVSWFFIFFFVTKRFFVKCSLAVERKIL